MINWMHVLCPVVYNSCFLDFSRNRLASDELPLGDSSIYACL